MTTIQDIHQYMLEWAPLETAAEWDNVGLQVGDYCASVSNVSIAVECNRNVWNDLVEYDIDCLITHHPLFFKPCDAIDLSSDTGRVVKRLMKKNIHMLSYHSNLDVAKEGVNDQLIRKYHLNPDQGIVFGSGFGKWFELDEVKPVSEFQDRLPASVEGALDSQDVKRVAFCAGSGKSLLKELKENRIELLITGEFGYHESVFCDWHGIKVLVLGHHESERFVIPEIKKRLEENFSDLKVNEILH